VKTARGFTLIEFTVTFVVLALLTVLTMPSIGAWIANARMRSVAESMQNGLRMAQVEAVRRNRQTVFALTNATPGLTATPAANGSKWFVRALALPGETADATFYVQGGDFPGQNVSVSGPAILCFNSMGRLVANASTGLGSNCGTPADVAYNITNTSADRRLQVQVSLAGRVRMCDRDRSLASGQPDGC